MERSKAASSVKKVLLKKGIAYAAEKADRVLVANQRIKLACRVARQVEHFMLQESKDALAVFERYAVGVATEEDFAEAKKMADHANYFAGANSASTTQYAAASVVAASCADIEGAFGKVNWAFKFAARDATHDAAETALSDAQAAGKKILLDFLDEYESE